MGAQPVDDVEREVLSLLTEDAYGLWELPGDPLPDRVALRPVLAGLLRRGLVEWYVRDGDGLDRAWAPEDGPLPDLGDDALWALPAPDGPDTPRVALLVATDAGDAAYFGR